MRTRRAVGKRAARRYAGRHEIVGSGAAMVRIGTVWDRTVDVLQGRTGILAGIALLTMVLPGVAGGVLRATGGAPTALGPVVAIATVLLLLYGILAITAVASDPAVDGAAAYRIAGRRLLAALGVLVVLIVAATLFFLPAVVALAVGGARMNAAGKLDVQAVAAGPLALSGLLALATVVAGLWLSARLVPLFGIVVNETRGLGALRRSLALTRGSTMKLIGVLILYAIVVIVLMMASTSVVGIVARLVLGGEADATVALVVAIVSALVSALTSVVQSVFYAQFYVAARAQEQRMAPLA